jgi:peptide/nickel transport system substrate-binding protein
VVNDNQELQRAHGLVDALYGGRLTRRQLLERAGVLGVGAATLGAAIANPSFGRLTALAQASGEITIASDGDIDTLDPHISQLLVYGNQIRFTVFNGLVKYAPDLSYVGDLAASWTNPDDKTYVFVLKDGLTYHDGTAVQASDIQFSYERAAASKTIWASRVANIDTYEVQDAKTIKITLKTIQADFIDGLVQVSIISPAIAAACFAPMPGATPEAAPAGAGVGTTAIGTGPFKFISWTPNDNIQLEANPNYHEAGVPGVSKLTFKILTDAQVAIANVQSGTVNAALNIPVSQAAPLQGSKDVTPIIVATSSIPLFEFGKNNATINGSAKVRQALASCLDKDSIQQVVYNGQGKPKWSFVPTSHWAYKEEAGYPYNTGTAKQMLSDEGVSNFEFTCLCIQGYPDGEKAATIWQAGLAEAGVKMNIEVQELSVWLNNYINETCDVLWNVFPGFADPNYFVSLGLKPHLADTGNWKNPDAAKLADEANQTLDQAKRTDLYAQLQDITVADLPVIIIQETPQASITQPNVSGWQINPLGFVFVDQVKIG